MEQIKSIKRKLENLASEYEKINSFDMEVRREIENLVILIYQNKQILSCNFDDISFCLQNAISCGVSLSPDLKMGYILTPGRGRCIFYPGYQSFISRLKDTGHAEDVWANVVYENCKVSVISGSHPKLFHEPYYIESKEPGDKKAIYACARIGDSVKFEYRPYDYFKKVIKYSNLLVRYPAMKDNEYFIEDMETKTMIKYLWKYMPKNKHAEKVAVLFNVDNSAYEFSFKGIASDNSKKSKSTVDKIKKMNIK